MASAIIISHDVDHIGPYEHLSDLVLPKFIVRAVIERARGIITSHEFRKRFDELMKGKWNYIDELTDFDLQHNVNSTFFFAVGKGLGLNYDSSQVKPYVDMVVQRGLKIGVHGIERNSIQDIAREKREFLEVFGYQCNGIRLHYLGRDYSTIESICNAGYLFDSSLRGDGSSFKIGGCIHFPVHVMDSDVFTAGTRYQNVSAAAAIIATRDRISKLVDAQTDFISILFHDRYFSDAHSSWKEWYQSIIEWIISQKVEMIDYHSAVVRINAA